MMIIFSFIATVIDVEIVKTESSFLRLDIGLCNGPTYGCVPLGIAEITYSIQTGLIPILFLFFTGFYFNNINFNSRKRACSLSLVSTIVATLSLPTFASSFRGLRLMLKSWRFRNSGFLGLSFWFFSLQILFWRALNIVFGSCRNTASSIVLISLTSEEAEPKSAF